jgi:hypothetical protein
MHGKPGKLSRSKRCMAIKTSQLNRKTITIVKLDTYKVFLLYLSHQRDSIVLLICKNTITLNVTFFTHRDMLRYIEKYAVIHQSFH